MIDVEEFLASHPRTVAEDAEVEDSVEKSEGHGSGKRRSRYEVRTRTHTVPIESSYTGGFGLGHGREDPQSDSRNGGTGGIARFGGSGSDDFSGGVTGRSRSGSPTRGKGLRGRYGRRRNGYRPYRQAGPVKRVPDDPADVEACREAALTLLDASAKSSGALVKRLVEKGYDETVSRDVVARLAEVHLIDDEDYARELVRGCAGRMMGERGTVMELKRKGVEAALAQSMVRQAREQGVFEDAAWELGRTVASKTCGLDLQVRRRRFWVAGGRKGHDPSILREIAQQLFADADEQ